MEPVKFEEQAKKQLQNREITPSEGSWERLEQRLDAQTDKKKVSFWWIGAAAAIAVVFFFLGSFFGDKAVVQQTPVVVETPSKDVQQKVPQKEEHLITPQQEEKQLASEATPPKEIVPVEPRQKTPDQQQALAVTSERSEEEAPYKEEVKNTFLEPREMIALTSEEKGNPSEVSDAEVEALLMLASAEIEADPAYAESTVNAGRLLDEVEDELEQSFRDKVFEVLKDGLVKAKTAVANRNF